MEMVHTHEQTQREVDQLTPSAALRFAWAAWLTMLALPFFVFLGVVLHIISEEAPPANDKTAQAWFVFSLIWLGLCVPAAFFLRSAVFKAYWVGQVVQPRKYLVGMISIWLVIEIGGLIALFGCYFSHSLMPNILPAAVAFVLFTPFWPTGKAMTRPVGNAEDPEVFRHPR